MERIVEVEAEDAEGTAESTQIVSLEPYDVHGRVEFDSHSLGMAIAHMSAKASSLADAQYQLQFRQSHQLFQHHQHVEARVEYARAESNARSQELAAFINQNHVNPTEIDHHITVKIRAAMEEARAESEAHARAASERQVQLEQVMETKFKSVEQTLSQLHVTSEQQIRTQQVIATKFNAMEDVMAHVQLASEEQMQARQDMKTCLNAVKASVAEVRDTSEQQIQAQNELEIKMTAAVRDAQTAVVSASEQRTKELLGAYFKHHAAQTKIAIAAEAKQSAQLMTEQIGALENRVTKHMENSVKLSEKKARAAVRRHLANENMGVKELEERLLKAITENEQRDVARAECEAKTLVDGLVTRQLEDGAMLRITTSDIASSIVSGLADQPTFTMPDTIAPVTEDEGGSTGSEENLEVLHDARSSTNVEVSEREDICEGEVSPSQTVRQQRGNITAPSQSRQQIVVSEQSKVMSRALSRARTLRRSTKSKSADTQNPPPTRKGLSTSECVAQALKLAEKREAVRGRARSNQH